MWACRYRVDAHDSLGVSIPAHKTGWDAKGVGETRGDGAHTVRRRHLGATSFRQGELRHLHFVVLSVGEGPCGRDRNRDRGRVDEEEARSLALAHDEDLIPWFDDEGGATGGPLPNCLLKNMVRSSILYIA